MILSDLSAYVRNLSLKSETLKKDKLYYIRANKQIRLYIKKLLDLKLITLNEIFREMYSFKLKNLQSLKVLKNRIYLNLKNLSKLEKQYLREDSFACALVSTSKGLKTLEECKNENIGGVLRVVLRLNQLN